MMTKEGSTKSVNFMTLGACNIKQIQCSTLTVIVSNFSDKKQISLQWTHVKSSHTSSSDYELLQVVIYNLKRNRAWTAAFEFMYTMHKKAKRLNIGTEYLHVFHNIVSDIVNEGPSKSSWTRVVKFFSLHQFP